MTELRYETATRDQLKIARESLIRLGKPVTESAIREWFAQFQQPRYVDQPQSEPKIRPCASPEVIARRKPRRKPIRSLEELHALGDSGVLKRKKCGRKRIVASWFERVAHTMRDGTGLKTALLLEGVKLTPREIKRLYELREFRAMYQAERKLWRMEKWGKVASDEKEVLLKRFAQHFGASAARKNI